MLRSQAPTHYYTKARPLFTTHLSYYLAGIVGIFSRKSCSMTVSSCAIFKGPCESPDLLLSAVKK